MNSFFSKIKLINEYEQKNKLENKPKNQKESKNFFGKLERNLCLVLSNELFQYFEFKINHPINEEYRDDDVREELDIILPGKLLQQSEMNYFVMSEDEISETIVAFLIEHKTSYNIIEKYPASKVKYIIPSFLKSKLKLKSNKELKDFINLDFSPSYIYLSLYINSKMEAFKVFNFFEDDIETIFKILINYIEQDLEINTNLKANNNTNTKIKNIFVTGKYETVWGNKFLYKYNVIVDNIESCKTIPEDINFMPLELLEESKNKNINFLVALIYSILFLLVLGSGTVLSYILRKSEKNLEKIKSENIEYMESIESLRVEQRQMNVELEQITSKEIYDNNINKKSLYIILEAIKKIVNEGTYIEKIEFLEKDNIIVMGYSESISSVIALVKDITQIEMFDLKNHDYILNKQNGYEFQLEIQLKTQSKNEVSYDIN